MCGGWVSKSDFFLAWVVDFSGHCFRCLASSLFSLRCLAVCTSYLCLRLFKACTAENDAAQGRASGSSEEAWDSEAVHQQVGRDVSCVLRARNGGFIHTTYLG